jgi:hypothetical protein
VLYTCGCANAHSGCRKPTARNAAGNPPIPSVEDIFAPIHRLSVENIWDYLRSNFLSHCVWDTYEAILDACCDAWNALMEKSNVITSIGTRKWAQVTI